MELKRCVCVATSQKNTILHIQYKIVLLWVDPWWCVTDAYLAAMFHFSVRSEPLLSHHTVLHYSITFYGYTISAYTYAGLCHQLAKNGIIA